MGKRIHDAHRWQQRPKFLWRNVTHFLPHLLYSCNDAAECPFDSPVIFKDPHAVGIEGKVNIGGQTILERGVFIEGPTTIGKECKIGPFTHIGECAIGNRVHIQDHTQLRRCTIGDGVRIPHGRYLGDATIGENTNIGADTVTSNWDGCEKQKTIIGARSFVGTFVDFIAPVTVGEECFIASRTRVSSKTPIPPHSFVYERINEHGFAKTEWKENCAFKFPHYWKWIWTKKPVSPEYMKEFFHELSFYQRRYDQWLLTPHPALHFCSPKDIIQTEGEACVQKILQFAKGEPQ